MYLTHCEVGELDFFCKTLNNFLSLSKVLAVMDVIFLPFFSKFKVTDEEEYEDDDGLFRISASDVAMEL